MSSNSDDLILVTGSSGFIATHIVKQLLEFGFRVRGTVRDLGNESKLASLKNLASRAEHHLELCQADLLDEHSWLSAVNGCSHVIHTASPFPSSLPENEQELIGPAVNGTLFVLRACVQPEATVRVRRVVLTSSVAAVAGDVFESGHVYRENDWPDLKLLNPYPKRLVKDKLIQKNKSNLLPL